MSIIKHKWEFSLRYIIGVIQLGLLCFFGHVHAQQYFNPRFSHFTINNGLSQSLVYCVTQDQTGFMWFGTKDGLNRFDGYEFKVFHHDPFDSSSLSDNAVTALFTDSKGRLWIGTMNGGLDFYDSKRNVFQHFLKQNLNKGNINSIAEDRNGNLWIGTYGNGIFKLVIDQSKAITSVKSLLHYHHQPENSNSLKNNFILDVFPDSKNRLWVSSTTCFADYAFIDEPDLKFVTPNFPFLKVGRKFVPNGIEFDLTKSTPLSNEGFNFGGVEFVEDQQNRIWIANPAGLFRIDQQKQQIYFFDPQIPGLKSANVKSLCKVSLPGQFNKEGVLWLGFIAGAGVLDIKDLKFQYISNDPGNSKSLLPGSVLCIYQDRSGCLWLGSNGFGLSQFDLRSTIFPLPFYHTIDGSLRTENLSVRSFMDTQKFLLIGTTKGLIVADKETKLMSQKQFEKNVTATSVIYSISPINSESCWLATNSGLIFYNYITHSIKKYFPNIQSNGQTDNRIFKLFQDSKGQLWCLTPYSISRFDIEQKAFSHFYHSQKPINGFSEPTYGDICEDHLGNFWIGTGNGLLYFEKETKKLIKYETNISDPQSLSFNAVRCVLPDPKNPKKYLWVGTAGGGLNRLDIETKKFIHLTDKNGLPNNVVYGILPDEDGNLWISTNKGLAKFNPTTIKFQNFDVKSGLQSNEFNSGAFYQNKEGKLFFGGITGFNAFYPRNIISSPYVPPIAFTGFSIFNHPVSMKDKESPLQYPITETKDIKLPYSDNTFSFQVAGLDYSNPQKNLYAYKLIPVNENWINLGTNRLITFNNLAPGKYVLHVKAANSDGVWNENGVMLNISILPPWWKTWWAYLFYFSLLFYILYIIRRYELKRLNLRNSLRVEHLEAEKQRELNQLKSRFFSNISHEFRTPLTLIMGPVEDLISSGNTESFKDNLPDVHRNLKRLLLLINQLLDLAKLDENHYQINTSREDIISYAEQLVHSFLFLAERKNISLNFEVNPELKELLERESVRFYFDEDIFEKILGNLLSNALKFTGREGSITVRLGISKSKDQYLELGVHDTGIGIGKEKLVHVFDRFYQVNDSEGAGYDGTGVGLALIKELMNLLHGETRVESTPGKGSSFYCYFPFNRKIVSDKPLVKLYQISDSFDLEEKDEFNTTFYKNSIHKNHVLIIEDHKDVQNYIRKVLDGEYYILHAKNGKEGLEIAKKEIPDLVVSDVMMPEMNGYELCKMLKTDHLTSHIPVILLTARADQSDKMIGLETGADAYMVKPFNASELKIRVKNLIELRKRMRAKFSDKLIVKPEEITVTSIDQQFIQDLMSHVEKHLDDPMYSVTILAKEMNLSVSQVNRKLKAIIDQSPQKFIRSVRMQRALLLLKNHSGSISEISWQVGFEDPGYFSKVFKSHFGCLPSERDKLPI